MNCMYIHHHWRPESSDPQLDHLKLYLQMVASYCVGAENWTRTLWKSQFSSWPLGHFYLMFFPLIFLFLFVRVLPTIHALDQMRLFPEVFSSAITMNSSYSHEPKAFSVYLPDATTLMQIAILTQSSPACQLKSSLHPSLKVHVCVAPPSYIFCSQDPSSCWILAPPVYGVHCSCGCTRLALKIRS